MQSSRKRFLTGTKVARNREIIEIVKVEKNREKNKERVVNREKNKERVVNIQGTWLLVHDTEKFKRVDCIDTIFKTNNNDPTKPAFTCSKTTIETLGQCLKSVQN